ncbi:MAG: DUF721 domain-containing protein [bacterium]|nr:DUF721 domain-containing protein [bacterium]
MSNNKHRARPRTIASFLPKITGKVLAKKGFPNMSLITDWPAIVGPELAAYTCPEKMSWPRQDRQEPSDEIGSDFKPQTRKRLSQKPQRGITLKLRVESHQALDIQYSLAQIIERINSYFGYRAVTDIRIIQGPVGKTRKTPSVTSDHIKCQTDKPLADLSTLKDEGLRKALERLDAARRK